jgi:predicted nucleic acid-binding protein
MTAENRLIDTNVLVYAYDLSEKMRRQVARKMLDQIWDEGGGVVAVQNLSEFFVVVTRKVQHPFTVSSARTIISDMLRSGRWLVLDQPVNTIIAAIDLMERTRVPYWDALIAACMLQHGVTTIVTENERVLERFRDSQ